MSSLSSSDPSSSTYELKQGVHLSEDEVQLAMNDLNVKGFVKN
jgi:hypothetical protein